MHEETLQASAWNRAEHRMPGPDHLQNDDKKTVILQVYKNSCHEDEGRYSEPRTVFLDTITRDNSIDSMSSYPNKSSAAVRINDRRNIQR